jgi:hypothetical protein
MLVLLHAEFGNSPLMVKDIISRANAAAADGSSWMSIGRDPSESPRASVPDGQDDGSPRRRRGTAKGCVHQLWDYFRQLPRCGRELPRKSQSKRAATPS